MEEDPVAAPVPKEKKEERLPTYRPAGTCLLTGACLLVLGLGGAGLLVWWAVVFHPSNEQLWMVPVSLVLLGTSAIAWLSILTSGSCRRFEMLRSMRTESMQEEPEVLVVRTER